MRVHSDDADIVFEVTGEGPPVILLHPFPADHEVWSAVAGELAPRYRVILPDLRGHGASEVGEGPATMDKHAADVVRVCEAAGVGRAVFAGISIGGYILFEFWRRSRERVAALVLSDTRPQPDTSEGRATRLKSAEDVLKDGTDGFVAAQILRLLGETTRRNRPDLVEQARRMMQRASAAGIAAVQRGMAARPDSTPTLKTIDVPTLLLAGGEDALTPVADAELMRRQIAGSRLEVIPQAGHYSVFEQPEAAARLLRAFLDPLPRW